MEYFILIIYQYKNTIFKKTDQFNVSLYKGCTLVGKFKEFLKTLLTFPNLVTKIYNLKNNSTIDFKKFLDGKFFVISSTIEQL